MTVPFERKVYLYVKENGYRPEAIERAVLVHDNSKGDGPAVSKAQAWRCQIAEHEMKTVPSIGDFISDDDVPEPAEAASQTLLREQLMHVLHDLTPREEKVLRLRYGIDDGKPRTLEEVGKEFNVTRERIRQIEAKALRKLRHPSRSKRLKDFIE